jgi:hypothetical protein
MASLARFLVVHGKDGLACGFRLAVVAVRAPSSVDQPSRRLDLLR